MNDLRFSFRQLLKSPGFTLVAILTLALGIAAKTAIFSVVDAVLLHPLPYPDSERLVTVSQTVRSTGVSTQDASPANFIDWQTQNSVFSSMACARGWQANLSGDQQPERVRATMASGQFFALFGVNPNVGRSFGPNDAKPGNSHVVVLSDGLWSRRFAGDRGPRSRFSPGPIAARLMSSPKSSTSAMPPAARRFSFSVPGPSTT